ncbi:MAG: hypothetical protein ABI693_13430 [Bryobacteraceae bacterium]
MLPRSLWAVFRLALIVIPATALAAPPVIGAHHAVISVATTEEAQQLQRTMTGKLGLPAAWPLAKYGARTSGGVFFGNFIVEIAVWPQVDSYQFLGLALEAPDMDAAFTELRARGLGAKDRDASDRWRNGMITQLAGEGLGIFLTQFNQAWSAPLMDAAKRQFAVSGGGPFGITGVTAIEIVANASRREAIEKTVAPARPESLSPALRLVDGGRYQVRSLVVQCKEPEAAKAVLPAGMPLVFNRP